MDPLLACCIAFLLGTLAGADLPVAPWTTAVLALVHLLSWSAPLRLVRRATAILLFAGCGAALTGSSVPPMLTGAPRTVTARGIVRGESTLSTETRLVVRSPEPPYAPDLRVRLRYGTHAAPGSTVTVRGKLLPPRDRGEHLAAAAQDIRGTILDAELRSSSDAEPGWLLRVRTAIERRLTRLHPGDTGALLTGLLTGGRSGFSGSGQEDVRRAGLAHLVAISGANFVLLIGLLERALCALPRRVRLPVLAAVTVAFWLFVDGGMAVSRAAVSTLVVLAALASGRPGGGLRALVFATTALCLASPLALRADASLQLSVLATLGVLLAGGFDGLRTPSPLDWRQTLGMSVATTAATLPVQFVRFGSMSLIAPVTNLLALPLVPVAMATGVAELALGWVPGAGIVLHGLAGIALGAVLSIAQAGAAVPFATVPLPTLPGWSHAAVLAAGFGIPITLVLRRGRKRPP